MRGAAQGVINMNRVMRGLGGGLGDLGLGPTPGAPAIEAAAPRPAGPCTPTAGASSTFPQASTSAAAAAAATGAAPAAPTRLVPTASSPGSTCSSRLHGNPAAA